MTAYDRVAQLITRLSLSLALVVALGVPGVFAWAVYAESRQGLDASLQTQAAVLQEYIKQQPDLWEVNGDRIEALFQPYVTPQQYFRVIGENGTVIFSGGPAPDRLTLVRSRPLYAFGLRVGQIEAGVSLHPLLQFALLVFLASLAVAWAILGPLRRVPLRALREAETALVERMRYQRALLDNFPFQVWLADRDGRILAANESFAAIIGKSLARLEGSQLLENIPPNQQVLYLESRKRLEETGRAVQGETQLEVAGQERWFAVGIAPVVLPDGQHLGTVGYAREITEEKAASGVLSRYRDHLEKTVRERTDELAAAFAQAEAASRAKTEFLSSVSHELRTPLNAILGFSQLLALDSQLDDDSRDMAVEIDRAGQHLLALVNDLIDIAQLESGSLALSIEAVPVKTVSMDSIALVAPLASQSGIFVGELDCHCNIEQVTVQADYQRLRQVLVNLLVNGIKYNRPGGTVHLSCHRRDDRVRIQVVDSGPGIPEEKLSRLFAAFDRLGAECGTVQGVGIGLVIAKRLVESMGGSIGVDSVVGTGSIFWVEFPIGTIPASAAGAAADTALTAAAVAAAGSPAAQGSGRNVLYVEDNPTNQELIHRFFARKRPDLQLLAADSAESGIEHARAMPPALILMDINLPGMNGYAALKVLKADARTAGIPVVAMSAHSLAEDVERGLQAGFAAYVTKPIDLGKLLAELDRLLPAAAAKAG